jgi:hypothetical protein
MPVIPARFLFPLDRCRRFAADVVDDPVDPLHLVDDRRSHAGQQVLGQPGPVGRHEVIGLDCTQTNRTDLTYAVPLGRWCRPFEVP